LKTIFRTGFGFAAIALLVAASSLALSGSASAQTLLHEYTFNTDASDSVGNANGTLFGGATVSGGTLNLNGVNGYVQFASHIIPTTGSYSVGISARETAAAQGAFVELISQGFSSGPGFYIGYDLNHVIRASDSWGNTNTPFPSDGLWHDYLVTVDAAHSNSLLYIDGTLRATLNSAITTTAGGDDTRLGRQFNPYAEYFNGSLDNVRIYSGVVTPAPVPEASTTVSLGLLLVLGLGSLAVKKRRKSSQLL